MIARSAPDTGRGREYTLPRLMFNAFACLPIGRSCSRMTSSCAQQARFAERYFQKIVLQRQLSDLGMQRLHIDGRRVGSDPRRRPEHPGGPFLKLRLPLRDLVGMNVEVLRQLSNRALAPDGGQRHFRLECRCVVPACSSAHRLS